MKLLVAFGTDDEKNLNDDHVGMAKHYHVYEYSDGKWELIEKRDNVRFTGDETMKHGDPEKARATSSVLKGIDVLVGKKFGPNLPRLLNNFTCVLVRTVTIESAIEAVNNNMPQVIEEKNRGSDRKHIILNP